MPKRKRVGLRRPTRRKRRRWRKARGIRTVVPAKGGFPRILRTKLVYSEEIELTGASAGASISHRYIANSIFDPTAAVGGHQPMFHDQYANVYKRYRVTRADFKVTISGREPSTTAGTNRDLKVYTVVTDNDAMNLDNKSITYLEEHPLTGLGTFVATHGSSKSLKTLRRKFNPRRVFGADWRDKDYGAAIGYDPTHKANFFICAVPLDPGSTLQHTYGLVTITYHVEFYDMYTPTQS